jgi:hypothetical protein
MQKRNIMMKHKYNFNFVQSITVEIDNKLIEYVNQPEFKNSFYDLDEEKLVTMVGKHLLENWSLSSLEGFVKEHDKLATLIGTFCYIEDFEKLD